MEEKIFITIIFISLLWIFLVLYFRGRKIQQVITKNDIKQSTGKFDAVIDNVISYPNRLVVNLIYNENEALNLDLCSDMSIHYKDLLSGMYKVPEHIKKGIKKDSISNNVTVEKKPEERLKTTQDVEFNKLVDISLINKV